MQPHNPADLQGTNRFVARHRIVTLPNKLRSRKVRLGAKRFGSAPPPVGCFLQCLIFSFALSVNRITAADAVIDHIELLGTNYVTIHFDTAPKLTYALQYTTNRPSAGSTNWVDLFVAVNSPFPNHYVIVDYRTNQMRFYRLKVTP